MIKVKSLNKTFGKGTNKVEAVKGVSLEIQQGQSVAIIGKSGAGKSTFLHMLGGLDRPNSGKVFVNEVDLYRVSEKKRCLLRNRKIGFVYQFYNLLPDLNALENVMLPGLIGKIGNKKQIRRKAEYLLSDVGLEKRFNHIPAKLSGGEAQRVAIARALITDPEILLCDEPTGNLDTATGEGIYNLLFKINKHKEMTLVVVTHNLLEEHSFSEVLYMEDGQVL